MKEENAGGKKAGRRGEGYNEKTTSEQIKKMRTKIRKTIKNKKKMKKKIKNKKRMKRKLNPSHKERGTRGRRRQVAASDRRSRRFTR